MRQGSCALRKNQHLPQYTADAPAAVFRATMLGYDVAPGPRRGSRKKAALERRRSFQFLAGGHEIRFRRRLPSWRRNTPLPARAEPHGTWLLADQTRRVGLCGLFSTCSASHQIDTVTKASRLLKIQSARRGVHSAPEVLDSVGHHRSTRDRRFGRHRAIYGRCCARRNFLISDRPLHTHSLPDQPRRRCQRVGTRLQKPALRP